MSAIGNSTQSKTLSSSSQGRGFESNHHGNCLERENGKNISNFTKMSAIGNSTVVEHLPHHPKFGGLSQAAKKHITFV
jgi:hypothetical protein